jgi:glyoxylase-like metal-dependent hydrolase (beta-lactamase superfamily II)
MKLGDFDLDILTDGFFRLDGGAMFGIVPRVVWEKVAEVDEKSRITLACNTLLVRTGRHTVLVDTGIGDKHDATWAEMYGVERSPTLGEGLAALGLSPADVDIVVLSHLHFDHAGGATVRAADGTFAPAFPKATYVVQEGTWREARDANPRTRGSYRPDDYVPLEKAGRIRFVTGDAEVCPGVRVRLTGGHVKFHQAVFVESRGRTAVYWGDALPTSLHVKPAWTMSYDLYPAEVAELKQRWLPDAVREEWLNVFQHDPAVAAGVIRDGYRVEPVVRVFNRVKR